MTGFPNRCLLVLWLLLAIGCGGSSDRAGETANTAQPVPKSVLEQVVESGELVIITRNAPTTYYEGRNHPEGVEYEMASAFADSLGVRARFVVKTTIHEVFEALESGEGHVACAGLTLTGERARRFLPGPPYQTVRQQVIGRRGHTLPKSVGDLIGSQIVVTDASSYQQRLLQMQEDHPQLQFTSTAELDTEHLLEKVWLREIDYTVADDNIVSINRRYYPELQVAFDISEPQEIVWYFPSNEHDLWARCCDWLTTYKQTGALDDLLTRYYGHIDVFDYVDTARFVRRIRERLPKYTKLFQSAADDINASWTVLAAISYQESHWRPNAKSPTGVRGMMMLSLPTASEVGVTNRLDAEQSIRGGATYLKRLYYRLPPAIDGTDRIWMTLAAYNVGLYHVYDARILAQRLGKNPDSWEDVKATLPLLSQKKYYKTVRYGYARGSEPVRYVTHIRNYNDILSEKMSISEEDAVKWQPSAQP